MSAIVISGFMGSGKTEVARKLAERLQRKLVDLDEVITQREGKSPANLISEDGERFFRTRETVALKTTLDAELNAVVALGGGAWIQEENRMLIEHANATSIWLDAPFEVCWQRIFESSEDRPLGRTKEQAQLLYDQRLPIYRLAQLHFSYVMDETADLLSQRIAMRLGG